MSNADCLQRLIGYLEENLRASQSSGLKFVDPNRLGERLLSRQNHIIFGRRGTGKSSLVQTLEHSKEITPIYLNLEDFKDITFPNIILHILMASYKRTVEIIKTKKPLYKMNFAADRLRRKLLSEIDSLQRIILDPDAEEQNIRTKSTNEEELSANLKSKIGDANSKAKYAAEEEISRTLPKNKLDTLRIYLTKYKELFTEISAVLDNESIFLIFDDFYFIPKKTQPQLIDYFHRITKGTNVFLKVATIKHRTILYHRTSETYLGLELGHDAYSLDMDYTLDKFDDLQSFMRQLLEVANDVSGANLDLQLLFGGDGFSQLCLASGGVPRDFLSIFVRCANHIVSGSSNNIGKILVNEEAITNISSKLESLKIDSGDEYSILEIYLNIIKNKIYDCKRTNSFLVAKHDQESFNEARQAIRELVDLRLLHLVDENTSSAPSDGRRYEAYILDIGLYENSRPRKFKQVDPSDTDSRSRKDNLRASPRLSLKELDDEVSKTISNLKLILLR